MPLPKPRADLKPNTADFERLPLVKPTGFREYDARWLFPQEINLMGLNAIGLGMATLFARRGVPKRIVVGHDFRWYSASVKQALMTGLLAGGCEVHDIGLALSPMAYFAQFALEVEGVAMVTASHNDNGWTGIKMGLNRPMTFGPEEMSELKAIVLEGKYETRVGGRYIFVPDMAERYAKALTDRPRYKRRLKVVAACGNGTAGAFAPKILEALGLEVIPLDAELDHSFPRYNPNPEDMKMLHAMSEAVLKHKADVGLGFDGDGDRCGVVDNEGHRSSPIPSASCSPAISPPCTRTRPSSST
jgi:phosphomannomutase/phosphoglucomutase